MAKWGSFLWGQARWGITTGKNLSWGVMIDWDGDGLLDGSNDGRWLTGLTIKRGRESFVRISDVNRSVTGFERCQIGRAQITLYDEDGRYNPYNDTSPLYPNVTPLGNKLVHIKVADNTSGQVWYRFVGFVREMRWDNDRRELNITAEDGLYLLNAGRVSLGVQRNIPLAKAIELVVAGTGLETDIGYSTVTLPYWWAKSKSHAEALHELAELDAGVVFITRDGKVGYRGRHSSYDLAASYQQSDVLRSVMLPMPWEVYRDRALVYVKTMELTSGQTVWTLTSPQFVREGDTFEAWVEYTVGGVDVAADDVTYDFRANTAEDETGTDLTSGFDVQVYRYATSAFIRARNLSGTDGYLTYFVLTGDAIVPSDELMRSSGSGSNVVEVKNDFMQDANLAKDIADHYVSVLSRSKNFPRISIDTKPELQFAPDLFDAVGVSLPALGIEGTFLVAGIREEWRRETGQSVVTTLSLEPYLSDPSAYWVFPTKIGATSVFA